MAPKQNDPPLAYGVTAAATALGLSWDSFHQYVAPHLKWVRLGRKKIVSRVELEKFLAECGERTLP